MLIALLFPAQAQIDNWQNKDIKDNGIFGISTDKAYNELLCNRKPVPVVVTVIDGGIDTLHEDLHHAIWHNTGEIPDNRIDDDHNGYVDDVIGWNFTGLPVERDSLLKLFQSKGAFYDSLFYTRVPLTEKAGFETYNKLKKELENTAARLRTAFRDISGSEKMINSLAEATGKADPSIRDFQNLAVRDSSEKRMITRVIGLLPLFKNYQSFKYAAIDSILRNLKFAIDHLDAGPDSANIISSLVNSNNNSSSEMTFIAGEVNDINDFNSSITHGTHIAGIIGADRSGGVAIKGVADHVKIMSLKVFSGLFPDVILSEETLAKAIRYAVDNGSRIINLSLAMSSVSNSKVLEDAVRYAMKKNVLIVRGAGNDGRNIDDMPDKGLYPTGFYEDGGQAEAWLTVGASWWKDNDSLAASFSNYGKASVDVFAPGVKINSTIPGNHYQRLSGTSMATPIVVGLAALIMEYYPKLSASQVKDIIVKSVVKVDHDVLLPGKSAVKTKVPFSTLCSSGGIVNVYNALRLAASYR